MLSTNDGIPWSWGETTRPAEEPPGSNTIRIARPDLGPDVAAKLRALLGLSPGDPGLGERAASLGRPLPPRMTGLDVDAWIAWCIVGLTVFGDGFPSLAHAGREAKRVVLVLAMLRTHGCLLAAQRLTGTTRKILRDNLRRFGLYPWGAGLRWGRASGATGDESADHGRCVA